MTEWFSFLYFLLLYEDHYNTYSLKLCIIPKVYKGGAYVCLSSTNKEDYCSVYALLYSLSVRVQLLFFAKLTTI